ncbi:MAG: sodium:solute symporter family transporter [Verrucomicrobiota bacterium]
MSATDYIVISLYLAGLLFFGLLRLSRKTVSDNFHLAGRSMGGFVIGVSTMATAFSALNFIAFSSEIFAHGLYVLMVLPAFILVAFPIVKTIIPHYHRLRLTSVYELLETVFDRRVRRLAACIFIFWRIAWASLILYALTLIINRLSGLNAYLLIAALGLLTTIYTATGGMRTVMITDVVQVLILIAAFAVALSVTAGAFRGFSGAVESIRSLQLLRPFQPADWNVLHPDPTARMTLWSCMIGGFVAFLSRYSADQMVVQRYFTARDLSSARRGFIINIIFHMFALLCLAVFGLTLRQWAIQNEAAGSGADALAWFISVLPSGLSGLLVTALLASTMSSIDSGIHSCGTSFAFDLLKRGSVQPGTVSGQQACKNCDRLITIAAGVIVTALACAIGRLGTIFEIANRLINAIGAPLLALFAASLKNNWNNSMNSRGVFWGGSAGFIAAMSTSLFVRPLALHYYAVVNFLAPLLMCYLASAIFTRMDSQKTAS